LASGFFGTEGAPKAIKSEIGWRVRPSNFQAFQLFEFPSFEWNEKSSEGSPKGERGGAQQISDFDIRIFPSATTWPA
jgi:hypothetical protein